MAGSRSQKSNGTSNGKPNGPCAKFGSGLLRSACEVMVKRPKQINAAVEGSISKNKKK